MTPATSPSSSAPSAALPSNRPGSTPAGDPAPVDPPDPVLCAHCGRTARNGLTCQGICVADSGY